MLIQFRVENHRSIKNSSTISFAASKDKSLENYLLQSTSGKKFLPTLAIYGANAAGKSNVLHAMKTMKDMIYGDASKISKGQPLPWEPFGETKEATSFEMMFIFQDVRYTYGFSFDDKKIYKEYLFHWPNGREALIFSRENEKYEFRENINEQTILSNRTPDNKLYLVSSNDWNLPQTEKPYRWFINNLSFLMNTDISSSKTITQISSCDAKKSRILKEMLIADLGITDVSVKYNQGNSPSILTTHRILNEDGTVEYFNLPMENESIGTQCFFARIGGWLEALDTGSVLVVDEIEDSLHPLLTKRLIEMVQNKNINTKNSQLIFTTHDAMLLDLNFLRRDQIWFAEKDQKNCSTELFPLSSFSPRKGENVRKGYLQGRFGAIPFIGDIS